MGRSGNNPGYKVFSINTTVRNPQRNIEFLNIIKKYDGIELTKEIKEKIYVDLIRYGVYQVNIKSEEVKEKYREKVILNDDEIITLIKDNPQKTKNTGRVMTQIRALKDQGIVSLNGNIRSPLLKITNLGKDLLDNKNIEDIYSKAMIGLHANNPQRKAMHNNSRPFLNTLFVLNEIEKYCRQNNYEYKGILYHEFGAFVLSMKDCNYKLVAKRIIEYRQKFEKSINKDYIENYLYNELELIDVKFKNVIEEYPDDVRRKFEMTSIIETHGFSNFTYLRINEFNRAKANAIIERYKDYKFEQFESTEEYENYLYNIELPWLISEELKVKIVDEKQKGLNVKIDENISLDEKIEELDYIYNNNIFKRFVEKTELELIIKEVLIIGKHIKQKSKFEGITESLRLEWLIAVLTAKVYGAQFVKPNMLLNFNGTPKYYAKGGKADIEFETNNVFYILETTTICNASQQLNSETTSVADHLESIETKKDKAAILIAPIIHKRTIRFYRYCCSEIFEKMIPITIDRYLDLVTENEDEKELIIAINKIINKLKFSNDDKFYDYINSFRSRYIERQDEVGNKEVLMVAENNEENYKKRRRNTMILKDNKELKQKDFKNEKALQTFFQNNIEKIIGYKFIDTEFVVGDFRIDTLAFDEETKSFRIIEYKNVKNHSLIDQGYTYLKLMLERKADFVLQYNIKTKASLTIQDVDWSQSRIIFVSPIYTPYQLNAIDFKNIPVDLIKVTKYEEDIIEIDFIKKTSNVKVQDIQMESIQNDINKEIIVYTEEDHLFKVSDNIKRVYEELKNRILELDDIDVDAKKLYIAFKGIRNIADIEFHKNKLKIYINMKRGTLNDPLNITEDISQKGSWGNGDYRIIINNVDDIDNVIPLIKQSLKVNKK